jgi:hypothetical protein
MNIAGNSLRLASARCRLLPSRTLCPASATALRSGRSFVICHKAAVRRPCSRAHDPLWQQPRLTDLKTAGANRIARHEREGNSFYEGVAAVKPPAAESSFTKRFYFRSYKQLWRGLARFTRECEHDSLVTTFYPCRHAMPYTRCCMRPSARRTGFGLGAPSIRTVMRSTRPGNSRALRPTFQRCKLLPMDLLTGSELRGDESRAFWNQALRA